MILVTDAQGRTVYKTACDRCEKIVALHVPPTEGREILCDTCRLVAKKAKPSTRVIYVKGKTRYKTRCDACGKEEVTQFIPFGDREFLCNACHRQRSQGAHRSNRGAEAGSAERPTYSLSCNQCGRKIEVKFRPDPRERYFCPDCYSGQRRETKPVDPDGPTTRVMFHIECVECGKKEVLNFVPSNRSGAICSACFKKRRERQQKKR